jgi:glyoxylase I family protein
VSLPPEAGVGQGAAGGEERRMRLRGLHHVTAICADMDRTIAFYRDLLGLAVVHDGVNDDDASARHVWFGDAGGAAGSLVSFMEYPALPEGVVGRGSTHHLALVVETVDEQEAWRTHLQDHGVPTSDVLDRGPFRSLYFRDPDGHLLEIATRGPGFGPAGA